MGISNPRRGMMIVLAAPSGAGKSTIVRALRENDDNLAVSVSATTRPPRPGEEEGVHYFFKDETEFKTMVEQGEFLEWAEVFGKYYGTPKGPVEKDLSAGRDVFFDIDWQGAEQLRENAPTDLVWITILPPSIQSLEQRLRDRKQDSEETIQKRMDEARSEASQWIKADYVVINEDLESAVLQVRSIIDAERLKRTRQIGLQEFVSNL